MKALGQSIGVIAKSIRRPKSTVSRLNADLGTISEHARLLGFESFAHYRLDDTMAKTPQAVGTLLQSVFEPALALARREEEALQAIAASEGGKFEIAPWDWRYYAEKQRKCAFDFDESEISPIFSLKT